MCKIVLHIKAKEVIKLDSIHFLEIEFKPSKGEEEDAWKGFQASAQPHILFWVTGLAEYLIISFHAFGC